MCTFFHGWRRKVGCVTLMLACGLMAMWMRSDFLLDRIMFVIAGRQHDVQSLDGKISWNQDRIDAFHEPIFKLQSRHPPKSKRTGSFDSLTPGEHRVILSYWSLTIPLGLLSTYLILWKPRKRNDNRD
ncbi:MAG: hypothetical protein JWP89_3781 [Schlesneria sp.]|nr:hypothetical protein [Schlesneria sp.]